MNYRVIDETSVEYKQEQQRLQSLRTQVVLWLVVLALGVVLIPLMLITGWVRNDVTRLETELLTVQNVLNSVIIPSDEVVKLGADVAQINQLVSSMQTVTIPSGVQWPQVVGTVAQYDRTAIELVSLTQTTDKIQIAGRATSNDAVVRYQQTMIDSGEFRDVVVISMSTVPPTPTPVPAKEESDAANSSVDPAAPPSRNVEFVIDLVLGTSAP